MMEEWGRNTEKKEKKAIELTRYLLHKHYCENDPEALIELFDEKFSWLGAGEQEYGVGREYVAGIFRQFAGQVPKCNISEEEYDAIEIAPDTYVCSGRLWIATDPSEKVYLRVHQRVTTVFRWTEGQVRCCHIHISNPYVEMAPDDVGFPEKMARQSYEYMQECLEEQKRKIVEQTAELASIYNTVPCVIMRLLRTKEGYRLLTFNRALAELLGKTEEEIQAMDWSGGYCVGTAQEDILSIQEALRRLRNPGDYSVVDYRIKDKKGNWIYLSSNHLLVEETKEGQIIQKIAFDITRRVELERILEQRSFADDSTGLYNRNKFNQEMASRREPGKSLGVACFDINGLKSVNDRLGHGAGDDLIRRVAAHLERHFHGKAYRIGGDEFVVADDGIEEKEFMARVEQTRREMEADGIRISMGCSWKAAHADLKEQFNEADMRMYQDKKKFYSDKRNDRRQRKSAEGE